MLFSFLPMKDVVIAYYLKDGKTYGCRSPTLKKKAYLVTGCISWILSKELWCFVVSQIQELLPSCDVHSDASHINTWIFAALCCKFQELKLDLYQYNANESLLPHCLFTFQSLTVLELYLFHDLKLLSTICLPNLKELKLSFITFVDDHSTQLFDGCLNLRKVTLDECTWKDEKFVFISSPMLKFLSICDLTWDDGSPNDCQVVTCGTNLKFFSYSGELKTDFCLYSSSLVNGCMDLRSVTVSEWMENKGKLLITCVSFLRGSLVLKAWQYHLLHWRYICFHLSCNRELVVIKLTAVD